MQDSGVRLPDEIYSNYLEIIDNVKFSPREIDVMACLLKGRTTKKIACVLSISPKTVATHIRNIMLKLEVNSREGVVDFIEKTNKLNIFQTYYQNLLTHNDFDQILKKISKLVSSKCPTCSLVFSKGREEERSFVCFLETHLTVLGIKVCLQEKNDHEQEDFRENQGF